MVWSKVGCSLKLLTGCDYVKVVTGSMGHTRYSLSQHHRLAALTGRKKSSRWIPIGGYSWVNKWDALKRRRVGGGEGREL